MASAGKPSASGLAVGGEDAAALGGNGAAMHRGGLAVAGSRVAGARDDGACSGAGGGLLARDRGRREERLRRGARGGGSADPAGAKAAASAEIVETITESLTISETPVTAARNGP